jgi:hypothetical protein
MLGTDRSRYRWDSGMRVGKIKGEEIMVQITGFYGAGREY